MRLTNIVAGAVASVAAPPRRSPCWAAARASLESHCAVPRAVRSWQALYRLLHRRPAPTSISWGGLLGDFTD
eukprot:852813-Alexandrium_andersonii.AAC.1